MRVLLIANNFDGFLDLALRAQDSGHQVKVFARKYHPQTRPIGKGLVELVSDFRPWMRWSELVLLEDNGVYMHEMERWRREGCRIIGGNQDSALWELDRSLGMRIFRKAGIAIPPYREFNDYDAAIAYVTSRDEPFASKPCGAVDDKSLSYIAKTPEDLLFMLRRWKSKHGKPPCPFILQEKVSGVEFAVGGWWGPGGWCEGWEENFEHKKLMPGDLGPNTGEMGTVMRYVRSSKLADQVLTPLESQLERLGYIGNVDVNCIVDEDGTAWPLEFTMRFGWPAFSIETALFDCDPIEFFSALYEGESARGAHRLNEIAAGVVMVIPPFPHDPKNYDDVVGIPLTGEDDGWHAAELTGSPGRNGPGRSPSAQAPNSSRFWSAGSYLGIGVGVASRTTAACKSAYASLTRIKMPASPFWRNDIGKRLQKALPELQRHGFARGLEY